LDLNQLNHKREEKARKRLLMTHPETLGEKLKGGRVKPKWLLVSWTGNLLATLAAKKCSS
jgi:hypothetical protein